jgi:MIP family channel proteins
MPSGATRSVRDVPLTGDYARRAAAEFVGVFAIVFVGAGSLIYGSLTNVALAYGLVVAVMVCAVAHVSGGHLNPAVTLGMAVSRRISLPLAVVYWLAQLLGAIAGAALLKWVLPGAATDAVKLGAPAVNGDVAAGKAVVVEAVLTFFVVWVFFAALVDPRGTVRQIGGLAVGGTVAVGVFLAGGLTGGMMNPARAFGPELIGNHWTDAWVWYLGPLAGGAVAAVLYELLYLRPARPAPRAAGGEPGEPRAPETQLP